MPAAASGLRLRSRDLSLDLLVVITAGNYNQCDMVNDSHTAFINYVVPLM